MCCFAQKNRFKATDEISETHLGAFQEIIRLNEPRRPYLGMACYSIAAVYDHLTGINTKGIEARVGRVTSPCTGEPNSRLQDIISVLKHFGVVTAWVQKAASSCVISMLMAIRTSLNPHNSFSSLKNIISSSWNPIILLMDVKLLTMYTVEFLICTLVYSKHFTLTTRQYMGCILNT